jgi:hypothetical protein
MIRSSTVLNFLLITILSITTSHAANSKKATQTDCVTCSLQVAPGAPEIRGVKSFEAIVAKSSFQDDDFANYVQAFCMKFEIISNPYAFKKEIIGEMKNTPYSFEKFWTQPDCQPGKWGGTVKAPIIHLAADEAFGRIVWLETLYKEMKDEQMFKRIINAKNTKGQTVLDYIVFGYKDKQYRPEEIVDVNALAKFLCEKGATFAIEKNQKCPLILK